MANGTPWRRPGPRWLLAAVALAVLAALIAVPVIILSARHQASPLALYRTQLLTTTKRLGAEELSLSGGQPAAPYAPGDQSWNAPPPRNARGVLSRVGLSISRDRAINGSGTLRVRVGAGGVTSVRVKPSAEGPYRVEQIAYAVTVTSRYASTRIVVWNIQDGSTGGAFRGLIDSQGWCVLSSTLLGPGPARTNLELGGGHYLPWCQSTSLGSGPLTRGTGPWLGLAGISPS
jgi:hypothetical protein